MILLNRSLQRPRYFEGPSILRFWPKIIKNRFYDFWMKLGTDFWCPRTQKRTRLTTQKDGHHLMLKIWFWDQWVLLNITKNRFYDFWWKMMTFLKITKNRFLWFFEVPNLLGTNWLLTFDHRKSQDPILDVRFWWFFMILDQKSLFSSHRCLQKPDFDNFEAHFLTFSPKSQNPSGPPRASFLG
jgi:hypothetical protein